MLTEGSILRQVRAHAPTIGLALVFLALLLGTCEILARTETGQRIFGPTSLGTSHEQFEVTLSKLNSFIARHGHLQCLVLGSSVVHAAVDPDVLAAAYRKRVGSALNCFNAGIEGIAASTSGLLAEILAHRYHPTLLIYGVTAHDVSDRGGWKGARAIERSPWVQYQTGVVTISGWLSEHSYAYRDYTTYRNWMTTSYWDDLKARWTRESKTSLAGYAATHRASQLAQSLADAKHKVRAQAIPPDWAIPRAAFEGLERISRLTQEGTTVLMVEVPVSQFAVGFFRDGKRDYERTIDPVARYAAAHAIPFWRTMPLDLFGDDGWDDIGHMNARGAQAFSQWLGNQVGLAVARHELSERPRT